MRNFIFIIIKRISFWLFYIYIYDLGEKHDFKWNKERLLSFLIGYVNNIIENQLDLILNLIEYKQLNY